MAPFLTVSDAPEGNTVGAASFRVPPSTRRSPVYAEEDAEAPASKLITMVMLIVWTTEPKPSPHMPFAVVDYAGLRLRILGRYVEDRAAGRVVGYWSGDHRAVGVAVADSHRSCPRSRFRQNCRAPLSVSSPSQSKLKPAFCGWLPETGPSSITPAKRQGLAPAMCTSRVVVAPLSLLSVIVPLPSKEPTNTVEFAVAALVIHVEHARGVNRERTVSRKRGPRWRVARFRRRFQFRHCKCHRRPG